MNPVSSSYEDTLRTMRTGKKATETASPLASLKDYMSWGRPTADALPYATGGGGNASNTMGGAAPNQQTPKSSYLSWPSWKSSGSPASTLSNSRSPFYDTFGLTMMQRYIAFAVCFLAAALMMVIAFVKLSFVVLRPTGFIVPYCFANLFLFVSFGFLHGFVSYARHLIGKDRMLFTAAYLLSTILTIIITFRINSFIPIVASFIVQFCCMIAYFISYIPGGTSGLSMFGSMATSSFRSNVTGF